MPQVELTIVLGLKIGYWALVQAMRMGPFFGPFLP